MDPILETIVKKYRKPWPDRDFWDFLRGVKTNTWADTVADDKGTAEFGIVFPDHLRVPTKPIEFKAENFQIVSSETLHLQMQAAINAMKDTLQNAPSPTLLPPALYERARYHYRNELEWFDKHYAVERKIPKS